MHTCGARAAGGIGNKQIESSERVVNMIHLGVCNTCLYDIRLVNIKITEYNDPQKDYEWVVGEHDFRYPNYGPFIGRCDGSGMSPIYIYPPEAPPSQVKTSIDKL